MLNFNIFARNPAIHGQNHGFRNFFFLRNRRFLRARKSAKMEPYFIQFLVIFTRRKSSAEFRRSAHKRPRKIGRESRARENTPFPRGFCVVYKFCENFRDSNLGFENWFLRNQFSKTLKFGLSSSFFSAKLWKCQKQSLQSYYYPGRKAGKQEKGKVSLKVEKSSLKISRL